MGFAVEVLWAVSFSGEDELEQGTSVIRPFKEYREPWVYA
jgi:hypothetical protein